VGYTHKEVAQHWIDGLEAKGNSVFTDGTTIWSWGKHHPIATKRRGYVLLNIDYASVTTTRHSSLVLKEARWKDIIAVTTEEIQEVLNHPEETHFFAKEKEFTIDQLLDMLRTAVKDRGVERFPMKEIKDKISKLVFLARLRQ